MWRGRGAYTQPGDDKGDAYAYREACHPSAIAPRRTRERVLEAMEEWLDRYGRLPTTGRRRMLTGERLIGRMTLPREGRASVGHGLTV